jgi:AcrR family transcriptional regulator
MDRLIPSIRIEIDKRLYVKDPESSDLGRRMVSRGIELIDELGFEQFNFRKLGLSIGSNESSVYRYFENKHKFLLYLISWYWAWTEYKLVFSIQNLSDPVRRIEVAIRILTEEIEEDEAFGHIDEALLKKIVVNEYSKSYVSKEVDRENKEGYFAIYKRLTGRIKDMLSEAAPEYPYPSSLASTLVENSLHQYFLLEHFPQLTDCAPGAGPGKFLTDMTQQIIQNYANGR